MVKGIPIIAPDPKEGVSRLNTDDAILVWLLYMLLGILLRAGLVEPTKILRQALSYSLRQRNTAIEVPVDENIATLGRCSGKEVTGDDVMNLGPSRPAGATSEPGPIMLPQLGGSPIWFVQCCLPVWLTD